MSKVRKYYNEHISEEDERLLYHAFELPITLHYIGKYIPQGGKILDIACGTGRYAMELVKAGYKLGLNDLAEKNLEITLDRLGDHSMILSTDREDALASGIWSSETWDAILLLGPLYHYPEKEKRLALLRKAFNHVKDGGYVYSGFMNRTQALVYGLKNNPRGIFKKEGAEMLWQRGSDQNFVEGTAYFTNAYFSLPAEIVPLIKESGLTPVHLVGCEGIFGERFELYHKMDKKLQDAWCRFILKYCEEPGMVHCSKHLLSISRKI